MRAIVFSLILASAPALASVESSDYQAELQWKICEPSATAVLEKLELEPTKTKSRETRFFETAKLSLLEKGVVIRDRTKKSGTERTVKIRFGREVEIDPDWFSVEGFKCEFDVHGSKRTFTCSLENEIESADLVLSSAQRTFLREYAPSVLSELKAARRLGVSHDSVSKLDIGGREFSLEESRVGGQVFIELSTRLSAEDEREVLNDIEARLKEAEIRGCGNQSSDTKRKLGLMRPER